MAYIDQATKAKLTPAIKAVLKKYGMKGTISIRSHMTLCVTLSSGSLDLIGDAQKKTDRQIGTYMDINPYWFETNFSDEKNKAFIREMISAIKGQGWYDRSDVQSDYFDCAYYFDISVGRWDKPYAVA
jgi:pectin methylesterase-like acyl-CoA thioesterase